MKSSNFNSSRGLGSIILTLFLWLSLVLFAMNLYRSYMIPNFDIDTQFLGVSSLIRLFVDFLETANINTLFDNLYNAFVITLPDISNGSIWDFIVGSLSELGDLILFPIDILSFIADIVMSMFSFLATFFGIQLPIK